MPALSHHPHAPTAARPVAAAALATSPSATSRLASNPNSQTQNPRSHVPLPFEIACGDEPPTAEDFADALNVAKNAALDVLVLALSGRTDEGLPTREALFAATRILAHSTHHDRLAAAPPRAQPHRAAAPAPLLAAPPRATLPAPASSRILPRQGEVSPKATEGATAFPTSSPRTSPSTFPRTPPPAPTSSRILPRQGEVSPKATEGATAFSTSSPHTSPAAHTPAPAPAASINLPIRPALSARSTSDIHHPTSDITQRATVFPARPPRTIPAVLPHPAADSPAAPATALLPVAPRSPALLQRHASSAPRNAVTNSTPIRASAAHPAPFLPRRVTTDLDSLRTLLDPDALLDFGGVHELEDLLIHGPSP